MSQFESEPDAACLSASWNRSRAVPRSSTTNTTGPGFRADLLDRAFEPFVKEDAGADATTGLGLAIVRAVAEAHGGSVRAENMPSGGARVTFSLRG